MLFTSGSTMLLQRDLVSQMQWLQELLLWQVQATRASFGALADDPYRGLYIPDAEADLLTMEWPTLPPDLIAQRQRLHTARPQRDVASAQSTAPLIRLQQLFDLSEFACDVLLLTLAPEIDLRFERLYGYIQDDVGKRRPSIDLALRLLCPDPAERQRQRQAFTATSPLLRHQLVTIVEDPQRPSALLGRFIRLDERIVAELLDQPILDPWIKPFVSQFQPASQGGERIHHDLQARLQHFIHDQAAGSVVGIQGRPGSGRRALVQTVAADHNRTLLIVDVPLLLESKLDPDETIGRILREATLRQAALLWDSSERLLHDDSLSGWRNVLLQRLDTHAGISFLIFEHAWEARGSFSQRRYVRLEMPTLTYAEREQLWRGHLANDGFDERTCQSLASTFRLGASQIQAAVTMARSLAHWNNGADHQALTLAELFAACRAQSSGRLATLARAITPTYSWDDIVLPADNLTQMREICIQVRHRRIVLESWGFDAHFAMGKGVNVLFAGPSGTGKTMAAEIIARDLGLELYKIDLSAMVSKYIGETEKNLDALFTAAREANAILLFDEADSLFGKRSEVKDAQDRYANIEVGYLLQKMEEYDGVIILSTNLRNNMDDAFVRRLHVAIEFPLPEEADRERIWRQVFPPQTPLSDDVDVGRLARQFKLTGGNIRNIALLAAFLAAEAGGDVGMAHIIWAIKREYQKIGKLVTAADFGSYLALARR